MKMKGQTSLSIDRNFILFIGVILIAGMLIYAYFTFFSSNNENIEIAENGDNIVDVSTCVYVITPAISPTGICIEFPTSCDVPEGWNKTEKCVERPEAPLPPIVE